MRSVFVILFVAAAACHDKVPKAGDVCGAQDEGTFVCRDPSTALFCRAQVRKAVPCRGPKGCAGAAQTCDDTIARVGDACEESQFGDPRVACSEDKQTQLACKKGHFELALHCRGPHGCDGAACDRSLLAVGDECYALDGWETCVAGKMATAACDEGGSKLEIVRECTGPKGCRSVGASSFCDVSVATAGAPCGKRQTSLFTCDPSGTSLLQCSTAHAWERSRACDKGEHCTTGLGTRGAECIR